MTCPRSDNRVKSAQCPYPERFLLRPFLTTDAEALFAYASAPEFSQYVEYPSPNTRQEVQDFLQQVLMAADPDCLSWAICQRDQLQVIGSIQMIREAAERVSVHYDVSHTLTVMALPLKLCGGCCSGDW